MFKEKEKRPNNKREEEVKTFEIGEREDAIWKERRAKIIIALGLAPTADISSQIRFL